MIILFGHNKDDKLCACPKCADYPVKRLHIMDASPIVFDSTKHDETCVIKEDAYYLTKYVTSSIIHHWLQGIKDAKLIKAHYEYTKDIIKTMNTINVVKLYDVYSASYKKSSKDDGSLPAKSYYVSNQLPNEHLFMLMREMVEASKEALLTKTGKSNLAATMNIERNIQAAFRRNDFHHPLHSLPFELYEWVVKKEIIQ